MGLDREMMALVNKDHPMGDPLEGTLAHSPQASNSDPQATDLSDGLPDASGQDGARPLGSSGVLGAFGLRLVQLGISRASALVFESDVRHGISLVIVHGTQTETGRAAALLERTQHYGVEEFDPAPR
jgi:hypothetical protein